MKIALLTLTYVLLVAGCSDAEQTANRIDVVAVRLKPAPHPAAPSITSRPGPLAGMRRDIAAHGASAFLHNRSEDDPQWARFIDLLQMGDSDAIRLAASLRRSADAGLAESLDIAAARALPLAPEAILKLTGSGFTVAQLCTSPFIEPEPGVESHYFASAMRALNDLPTARRPQPAWDECHAAIASLARSA